GRPGRPDHGDGAHGRPPAVPVLPAQAPLRAAHPRRPPPRPLWRRTADGVRRQPARRDRCGHRRRAGPGGRLRTGGSRRRAARRRAPGGAAPVTLATHPTAPAEQTRARYPDQERYVERDGVRTFYEVYGEGEQTMLLLPTWS